MVYELTKDEVLALIRRRRAADPSPYVGVLSVREAIIAYRLANYSDLLKPGLFVNRPDYGRHPDAYFGKCKVWWKRLADEARAYRKCDPSTFGKILGKAYGLAMRELEDKRPIPEPCYD